MSFVPDDITNPFTYQTEVVRPAVGYQRRKGADFADGAESGKRRNYAGAADRSPQQDGGGSPKDGGSACECDHAFLTSSTEERTNNIRVAFSKINGLIIPDGGKFSFNGVVGRRTEKNGFYKAIEYAYGTEVWGIGGGVCQASTTMYLAAIQAGLNITNRWPIPRPSAIPTLARTRL